MPASETIDLGKIKVGDEIAIRAEFVRSTGDGPRVRVISGAGLPNEGTVRASDIVSHTPKALAVGDRVTMRGWGKATLRLLCIHGPWAWMADDDDTTIQGPLAHLERA